MGDGEMSMNELRSVLHVWEVMSFNLSSVTGHPDAFHVFPQSLQANSGIELQYRPQPLPSLATVYDICKIGVILD
jgi:hypothetical protein